ncbi:MAG: trehalose-phosphatase, partial [Planctomycetota bacterium]
MTDAAEQQLSPELETRLMELVRTPVLLVASDYDGTLSPIVANPEDAVPHREALVALRQLADLPQTHAAIISGRSLTDLADLTGEPQGVHLVGSHGSEFEPDFASSLTAEQRRLRDRIETAMKEIAARDEGLMVETKPASVAFHFRNAPSEVGQECAQAVMDGPGKYDGVVVKLGKMVV